MANGPPAPVALAANFQQAVQWHQAGQLDRAEALYQQVLRLQPRHVEALQNLGVLANQRRQPTAAIPLFHRALKIAPANPGLHVGLGLALQQAGQPGEALACFDRALALQPKYDEAHYYRGNALGILGRNEEALASFGRALALRPRYAEALNARGIALSHLHRHEEAVASYAEALAIQPNLAEAALNRGVSLQHLSRHEEALASYDQALALRADPAQTLNARGVSLMALGQHEEALESIDRSLALRPGDPEALLNRGNVLEQLRRYEEALASYDQALALRPDFAEAALNRGIALRYLSRHEEALASYDRALALRPDYPDAWNARAASLWDQQRFDAALASYDQALALRPDFASAQFNEGCIRLLTGDFTRGWEQYEWRWRDPQLAFPQRAFAEPRWTGTEPLRGKTILLHAEQGIGDTLQFCRYVPLIAARGATIVLEVQPALQALLAQLPGVSQVIAQGEARPAFDYQCPLLSLPLAFRTELACIPAPPAYLLADEQRIRLWQSRLGGTALPRVGLAWSGSTWHRNDLNRSISLRAFQRLCVPGIEFISLQKEMRPTDQPVLDAMPDIRRFSAELTDFAETAALIACLDLVVCVDTAVLHLAGALGRPAWLLLPFTPDWRWLLNRDDSPWYPTVRLFRQPQAGGWDSVIARVSAELAAWAKARQPRE